MATKFTFNGAVCVRKQGSDEILEFIHSSDQGRLRTLGVILPADAAAGSCQVEGTIPGGVTGCQQNTCTGTCQLQSSTSPDGNTTTYWCTCS